jgi:hypothetical protein
LQKPLRNLEKPLVNCYRTTAWLLGVRPRCPSSSTIFFQRLANRRTVLQSQHDIEELLFWAVVLLHLQRAHAILFACFPGSDAPIPFNFKNTQMQRVADHWRAGWIVRYVYPFSYLL